MADSVAKRVKNRSIPQTLMLPPAPPRGDRWTVVRNLRLMIGGQPYAVGDSIEGDPVYDAAIDGVATLTIVIRDTDDALMEALGDESQIMERGVTTTVNGIDYIVQSANFDGTGLLTLTFEDVVKWRMSLHTRFISVRRTPQSTFAKYAERLVEEASGPPYERLRFFCPEINDRQAVPRPRQRGAAGRAKGTGESGSYKVKRVAATPGQKDSIDALLAEANRMGASRRLGQAAVMAATQESVMGKQRVSVSGKHYGLFHQDSSYGSVAQRQNDTYATNGFLKRWADRNGSLKTVRGDLAEAIDKVQVSGNPAGYRQWESEAGDTVDEWLSGGTGRGFGKRTINEPYEFTRGDKNGEEETSWDSLGRYAEERAWRRWAYLNTLWLVDEEELRLAAPSLNISGDEPWLLRRPSWDWASSRLVSEITISVLADRWGVQIGAVVVLTRLDPTQGRFIVSGFRGTLASPELEVTLHRPSAAKPEPANATRESTLGVSGGAIGTTLGEIGSGGQVTEVARAISSKSLPYAWGGGHERAGYPSKHPPHSDGSGTPVLGFDCSGATVAFLAALGHGFHIGGPTASSGGLMSWGLPGEGRIYTVWANSTHVYVEFAAGGRLDTSPHGDGPSGARFRQSDRPSVGFTPRHWNGF